MITGFIISGAVLLYVFIGSAIGTATYRHDVKECEYENHFGPYSWCLHVVKNFWLDGVFWPIGLAVNFGSAFSSLVSPGLRAEARHARELVSAQRSLELEKVRTAEAEQVHRQWELSQKGK